ncbi:hypothetical protein [Citricoccus muralis]|uniref:Uncharacterized protein n=1 Tax=Citricoccus muralis TaxID=169134 RepID=A0ABY8H8S0_9MICC|nr:hypothetical protein [Citricoccus muralis]WFP17544.1 hypothetical protein P8192_05415 [Citricoccus muralis]
MFVTLGIATYFSFVAAVTLTVSVVAGIRGVFVATAFASVAAFLRRNAYRPGTFTQRNITWLVIVVVAAIIVSVTITGIMSLKSI